MDASEFYRQNASLHGAPAPKSNHRTWTQRKEVEHYLDHWSRCPAHETRDNLLDIGCAQLNLLRMLRHNYKNAYGVDISKHDIWTNHPDIECRQVNVDTEKLPFPDMSMDTITMCMALEHVFDPFHAMREIHRLLKPTGWAVIQVPNLAYITHRVSLLRGKLPVTSSLQSFNEGGWDGQHLHQFTSGSLRWLMRTTGFTVTDHVCSGRLTRLRNIAPSLLGADLIFRIRPIDPPPPTAFEA